MVQSRLALGLLSAAIFFIILAAPLYATPSHDDNCITCHHGNGVTLNANATGVLKANASSSFEITVNAEGNAEDLTVKWPSTVNPSFAFIPSTVADNGPYDYDSAANKINAVFKVYTPINSGDYTIQVFAADKLFNGASLSFDVKVSGVTGPGGPGLENVSPKAYFLYSRLGMTLRFEDRSWDSDGNITSWSWNFGDNVNSTERNPLHTFTRYGSYTVSLTVTDEKGTKNIESQTFTLPSNNERLLLWETQVFIGSLMIVLTLVFLVGIASAPRRKKEALSTTREMSSTEKHGQFIGWRT